MSDLMRGRRRRSRAEADRLVLEYEQSGLTRKQFCLQNGISQASLDNYRKRKSVPMDRENVAFVPVELIGAEPINKAAVSLELRNGRRIEVAPGFDAGTLERLLAIADRI